MDLNKVYGYDEKKADQGVWFDLTGGGKVLLGMLGSTTYKRAVTKHAKPYQRAIRLNKMQPEDMEEITVRAEAEAILLDWQEFELNGEPLLYSRENALMVLRTFPALRAEIEEYANDQERFQDAPDLEADEKNSLISSSGT